jgi:protein associated with RNAse G/E
MTAGRPYVVESRSFDGRSRWEWRAEFVARAPSLLVLHSTQGEAISSGDRSYPWPADTLQFYWTDRWYNIRAALRDGEPFFYSCNVAMPTVLGEGRISYVDLDLELAVTDALSATLEGEEDFDRNGRLMGYPPDVVQRARDAVAELRSLVRAGRPPFRNYESLIALKRAL